MEKSAAASSSYHDDMPAVLFRTSHHNTIYDVLRTRRGWKETDSDTDWDINWADTAWIREFFDSIHFEDHQRVNHFRNHYELTRKDLTIKNLKRMKRHLERNESAVEAQKFAFFPATFVLPAEYGLFVEEFKKTPGATWIMKPIGRAQVGFRSVTLGAVRLKCIANTFRATGQRHLPL